MNAAWVISKREIRAYFNSPVAYIVGAVFLTLAGWNFFNQLFVMKQADMRGFFMFSGVLFVFIAPAITMRLIAEEKGSGTLELLITMPVRDWEVIVGKFLAALTLVASILAVTLVFALTTGSLGSLDRGPTIGGYLGLLLMAGACLSIGLLASTLTRNQIVAFIVSFAICITLFLMGQYAQVLPESLQGIAVYLSLVEHLENISRGVVDSRDVLYYLSIIAVCLTAATTALDGRRWK